MASSPSGTLEETRSSAVARRDLSRRPALTLKFRSIDHGGRGYINLYKRDLQCRYGEKGNEARAP